jgi:exosome complex RNA-binding protein Rrp4
VAGGFELVLGYNGRCWVDAQRCADVVLVSSCLSAAAGLLGEPELQLELVQGMLAQRMDTE